MHIRLSSLGAHTHTHTHRLIHKHFLLLTPCFHPINRSTAACYSNLTVYIGPEADSTLKGCVIHTHTKNTRLSVSLCIPQTHTHERKIHSGQKTLRNLLSGWFRNLIPSSNSYHWFLRTHTRAHTHVHVNCVNPL